MSAMSQNNLRFLGASKSLKRHPLSVSHVPATTLQRACDDENLTGTATWKAPCSVEPAVKKKQAANEQLKERE